jgi:hypothetical protein
VRGVDGKLDEGGLELLLQVFLGRSFDSIEHVLPPGFMALCDN